MLFSSILINRFYHTKIFQSEFLIGSTDHNKSNEANTQLEITMYTVVLYRLIRSQSEKADYWENLRQSISISKS